MPELDIRIAQRSYRVACADGGEAALVAAAQRLDAEATALRNQMGGVPDLTLLLMAGLVLADRLSELQAERDAIVSELAAASRRQPPERIIERIEVPVVPEGLTQSLADLTARAEALAAALERLAPALQAGGNVPGSRAAAPAGPLF
jgi:cell division protein ZapA